MLFLASLWHSVYSAVSVSTPVIRQSRLQRVSTAGAPGMILPASASPTESAGVQVHMAHKDTYDSLTKYCTAEYYGKFDGLDALDDEDDAAAMAWGSPWKVPSMDQCKELINSSYTTTEWTTLNGKYGRKITSKTNGNSVFLPAAGTRSGKSLDNAGSYGDYWSRTLHPYNSLNVYFLYFSPNGISTDYYVRSRGQSVRPVHVP